MFLNLELSQKSPLSAVKMFYIVLLSSFAMQFFASTGVHVGDQNMINNVAGFMVEQLTEKYPQHIEIGNLTSAFMFGAAKFEALFGDLSDIHTIERNGDVIVTSDNDEMNVTLPFTFKNLKVFYPEVTIAVAGLKTCGTLDGTAVDNQFSVLARISENSECFVALHGFNVIELGDFNVNFTPKKHCPIIGVANKVSTMAANYFQDTIKKNVEDGIHQAIRENIPPSKFVCVDL